MTTIAPAAHFEAAPEFASGLEEPFSSERRVREEQSGLDALAFGLSRGQRDECRDRAELRLAAAAGRSWAGPD